MAGSLTSSDRYAAAALLALALKEAQRARKGEIELEEEEEWALKETAKSSDFSWCSQECGILENTCRQVYTSPLNQCCDSCGGMGGFIVPGGPKIILGYACMHQCGSNLILLQKNGC